MIEKKGVKKMNYFNIQKKLIQSKINLKNWYKETITDWTYIDCISFKLDRIDTFIHNLNFQNNISFKKKCDFKINYISYDKNNQLSSVYFLDKKSRTIIRISKHWSNSFIEQTNGQMDLWYSYFWKYTKNIKIDFNCGNIKTCYWNLIIKNGSDFIEDIIKNDNEDTAIIAIAHLSDFKKKI